MDNSVATKKVDFTMILVLAFILVTISIFFSSVFLNEKNRMIFPQYIPANKQIGWDSFIYYRFGERYFIDHKSPYISDDPEKWFLNNPFPPLFTLSLAPVYLLRLTPRDFYLTFYSLTILSFILISFVIPQIITRKWDVQIPIAFAAITGLAGYGMQFELERGNFNIIAIALALSGVFIFWKNQRLRILAYFLFTLGVQFKLYPLILIFMFIKDIKNVKENLIRIGGLLLVNFACLFLLGYQGFFDFLRSIRTQTDMTGYVRDHGINNFVGWLNKAGFSGELNGKYLLILKLALILITLLLIVLVMYITYRRTKFTFLYPPLLLACLIGAMVLPQASRDYKLPLLSAGFGLYIWYCTERSHSLHKKDLVPFWGLSLIFTIGYCITLYSWIYRPVFMQNSFPSILVMLMILPALEYYLRDSHNQIMVSQ